MNKRCNFYLQTLEKNAESNKENIQTKIQLIKSSK